MILESLKTFYSSSEMFEIFSAVVIPILFFSPFSGVILFAYFSKKFKAVRSLEETVLFAFFWMFLRTMFFVFLLEVSLKQVSGDAWSELLSSIVLWCIPPVVTAGPEIIAVTKFAKVSRKKATMIVLFALIPSTILIFLVTYYISYSCMHSSGC